MAERPDEIEKHIQSTRRELGQNLQQLEHKVKSASDWKTYVERNPMAWMGAAMGAGAILAALIGGSGQRRRNGEPPLSIRQTPTSRPSETASKVAATVETMKGALIGLAAAKVRNVLNEAIPGFAEHYERAEHAATPANFHPLDRSESLPRM